MKLASAETLYSFDLGDESAIKDSDPYDFLGDDEDDGFTPARQQPW